MICLSYNCRGLANPDKRLALRDLLTHKPFDILFLQETLGVGLEVSATLSSFLPDWSFITLDARGRSGGCALGINNKTTRMTNCWGQSGVLAMNVLFGSSEMEFTLVNVYGPCADREHFWRSLLSCSLMSAPHLILGGDLNFSLGIAESWGPQATPDPLAEFFNSELGNSHLINIQTTKLLPTWRNRRTGNAALARRLDRFLIKQDLLLVLSRARQWVGSGGKSDHSPIFLEFACGPDRARPPFKFNSRWLRDPDYNQLVNQSWTHFRPPMNIDPGRAFNENLKRIKNLTILWVRNKKKLEREALHSIEDKISTLNNEELLGYRNEEARAQLFSLEAEKAKLLKQIEEDWRLKSRAIWIQAGDENTKFFQ